ncbi:MAG: ASKHA domain-containing protein [bacterium]
MAVVNFVREKKQVLVKEGQTIARAARKAGVFLETPCSGAGSCGKCKVRVEDRSNLQMLSSLKKLTKEETAAGYVFACCSQVYGDIAVYTDENQEQDLAILQEGTVHETELYPSYCKEYRSGRTEVYADGRLLGTEEGNTADKLYGLAFDIGTTTLVCALIDCLSGKEVYTVSRLNSQCLYAQDVISRINYTVQNENGLSVMYECLLSDFNAMIGEICQETGIERQYIYEAVYSGNTTMLHLATNTDPSSLGRYPYTPKLRGGCTVPAKALGISSFGRIYLPPIISAYVGADITSGILACELTKIKGNILFIDIGTNGEMLIASHGRLTATSTAAGPAFEGMNITFGQRACIGAVEGFTVTSDYEVRVKTIGDAQAKGICGSGLFDVAGEMVRLGLIEKSGRLVKRAKCCLPENIRGRLTEYDGKAAFMVAEGVYLTLLDIRQIQLAKSAIRAGLEAMLILNKLKAEELDRVYIAGSFGYHLKAESLVNVGLLPDCLADKIVFAGNTSKVGGMSFLLNQKCRSLMQFEASGIEALELSNYPDFEKLFVKCMSF